MRQTLIPKERVKKKKKKILMEGEERTKKKKKKLNRIDRMCEPH